MTKRESIDLFGNKKITKIYNHRRKRRSEGLNERERKAAKRCPRKDAKDLFKALRNNTGHEPEIHSAWHVIFNDYFIKNSKNIDDLRFISRTGIKWDDYLYSDRRKNELNKDKRPHPKQISILKIDADSIRALIEYKAQDEYSSHNLQDWQNRSRIVAQIIHYMKEIKNNGQCREPNVLIGADDRESFVLPSKFFLQYLNKGYNWNISPRQAFNEVDPNLIADLNNDGNLNIFPFRFDFGNFNDKYQNLLDMLISIENIGNNSKDFQKMPVNAHTFTTAYQQFKLIAFPPDEKISSVESVNIFMQQLTNRNSPDYFVNPNNKGFFFANGRNIRVNGARINTFMSRYPRNISPKLSRHLRGIADRLIQIEERREKGDFWTPSIWGDKANDIIHKSVDKYTPHHDFRNNALVWDMAAGVKNLTRDNKYKDLYISTIHQAELELGSDYNPEAKNNVFQYDYLHDDMDKTPTDQPYKDYPWKMPENLYKQLLQSGKLGKKGKNIIFFTNPPFKGTGNARKHNSKIESNVVDSTTNLVHPLMKHIHLGQASEQLYCQFFFRTLKIIKDFGIKNAYIAFFSLPRFLTGGRGWKKFNRFFFSRVKLINGFLMKNQEFSDTSNLWPVLFGVYKIRDKKLKDLKTLDNLSFNLPIYIKVLKPSSEQYKIIDSGIRHQYQLVYTNNSFAQWVQAIGSIPSDAKEIGEMVFHSDNVESQQYVWITRYYHSSGHHRIIKIWNTVQSLNHTVVGFAVRKCIKKTWVNAINNFKKPPKILPITGVDTIINGHTFNKKSINLFINDCLIYTLFNPSNRMTAKSTNSNQWFWLSRSYVSSVANGDYKYIDKLGNSDIYNTAQAGSNSYIFKQINARTFTDLAQRVLDDATTIWNELFNKRNSINKLHPEWNLNCWDSGWYQLMRIPYVSKMKSYKKFHIDYKKLRESISKEVYKLNIL